MLCKFEVPGYPGTPSKNLIYFWVEKMKLLIISSKTLIFFTIFPIDLESSCQTQYKYEVSNDLKHI